MSPSPDSPRRSPQPETTQIVVLNDGETYSALSGCAVYEVPVAATPEQIEAGLSQGTLRELRLCAGEEHSAQLAEPGPEPLIQIVFTEEDVRSIAAEAEDGEIDEDLALKRASGWASSVQDTVVRLCNELLFNVVCFGQP